MEAPPPEENVRPVIPALVVLLSLPSVAAAAPRAPVPKASEVTIPEGYPPLTDRDRSITSVPFAPGAGAVVLLHAEQYEWEDNFVRTRFARRVKILTEAGASDNGDYGTTYYGEWRVGKVKARTLLPDGTEVDASDNVHVESSKAPDITTLKVTFPRVSVGAILDLRIDANANDTQLDEWVLQEDIPILESRVLLVPAMGYRFRAATVRMPPEASAHHEIRYGENTLHAWIFRDLAPLPDVAHLPPRADIAQELVLIPESYNYGGVAVPLAADWKSWCRDMSRYWEEWLKKKSGAAAALAATVTQGATTPQQKAEAIRKALRDRMTRAWDNDWPSADGPDLSLAQGKGNSADIAGVAAAMLRAVGVPTYMAAYRQRSSGTLPTQVPAPNMIDDVLVAIPGAGKDGKDLFVAFWSDAPVGTLPLDALGVNYVPLTKASEGPAYMPEPSSAENATDRAVHLDLALDGSVKGDAMITMKGPIAAERRRRLARMSAEERKKSLEQELQRYMPTAVLAEWQVDDLDDPSKDLVIALRWEAQGLAQRAGGRLLLHPFAFSRIHASDWGSETREHDIFLGRPSMETDSVTITMPQDVAKVQLPAPAKLEAGPIGGYTTAFSGKDMTLTASRVVRFEQTLFPAASWAPLRSWFQDMAANDDQAIVLTLADAAP